MFAFDYWADWFKAKVSELDPDKYVLIKLHGADPISENEPNTGFGLSLDSAERIGCIGFWGIGLCDFTVIDVASDSYLEDVAGLEATDETIPILWSRFIAYYD